MGTMKMRDEMGTGASLGKRASNHLLFERYTEAARKAIFHARAEASRRDDGVITVADLLAGLSLEENTRAERIGSLKANAFYLRWLSGLPPLPSPPASSNGTDSDKTDNESQMKLDPDARRVLAFAVAEADRDREYWIDTDHLLRGLLRFPNKAHFAVLKTEINLKTVRIASKRDREEFLPEESSSLKVVRYLVRKHIARWVPPILGLACYLYILTQSFGIELSPLAR
jgi:ATP-dependent Clp protease ATP-binding subunit ClpA